MQGMSPVPGRTTESRTASWKAPWIRDTQCQCPSASPKRGCLNVGAWNPQESGRKAPLSCNAAISMLQCSFSFAAAQLLVQMTSALQKSTCCSAVSAAQHSKNCSATSVFACGMLQGWGLEGWGLGLPESYQTLNAQVANDFKSNPLAIWG